MPRVRALDSARLLKEARLVGIEKETQDYLTLISGKGIPRMPSHEKDALEKLLLLKIVLKLARQSKTC